MYNTAKYSGTFEKETFFALSGKRIGRLGCSLRLLKERVRLFVLWLSCYIAHVAPKKKKVLGCHFPARLPFQSIFNKFHTFEEWTQVSMNISAQLKDVTSIIFFA